MKTLNERSVQALALVHGALYEGTKKCIGWTVSPPANLRVPVQIQKGKRKVTRKVRYDFLTPEQQISFLVNVYIPKVIHTNVEKYLLTFEQNSNGNIHIHALCYDTGCQNDYAMTSLRKNVMQTGLCLEIAGVNKKRHMVLNYIHFLEDDQKWLNYIMEDVHLHEYPIYYSDNICEIPIL